MVRLVLATAVFACADTPQSVPVEPSDLTPQPVLRQPVSTGVPEWLDVPTYDSSRQAVHPDVVYLPGGWRGFEYWMAFTPYPGGNSAFENPSIVASHDGHQWIEPDGISEPIVPHGTDGADYNSDPDLFYSAETDQLVLVEREVRGGNNVLVRLASSDGVNWSPPTVILTAPNHQLISPTVVSRPGRPPLLWVVDAGNGCASQRSRVVVRRWRGPYDLSAGAAGPRWSKALVTDLVQPGYIIWHIDVTYVEETKQFWAIYPARDTASSLCTSNNHLFVASSADGVHWTTFDKPVLTTGVTAWASRTLYRSSSVYDLASDRLRVWLSAAAIDGTWRLGYVEVPLLQRTLDGATVTTLIQSPGAAPANPLRQPPPPKTKPRVMARDSFP